MVYIHVTHIAALLSSCVSFGLIIWSRRWDGEVGVLCLFCWTFSFIGSLLSLLMEIFAFHKSVRPLFWRNILTTISSYAALFCLNASIIFPHYFLKGQEDNEFYSHCIVAEIFSCIATLGHLAEVWIMWIESKCYMATGPGLLQVSQTYIASAIFFFLVNAVSFKDHPAVIWSLAVYCMCFICTFASIICCAFQNKHNRIWRKGFNLIAAVMYLSASWPVFQLSQDLGQIVGPGSCQDDLGLWPETRLIVVVALTALNFLLYLLSVCCCCMLPSSDDDEEEEREHRTSSNTSDPCPTQMSDETWAVLPVAQTRDLQQHNTTSNKLILSRTDLRIEQPSINIHNSNVQIIVKT
ncbi:hypothetical protein PGIGA_G00200040 [Pangasianodon gigas]|uniref:Uncharacterized protein n=1 Tax=Pangasianodon gigas TaxID=30993 RepID=A0ACC5WE57_PANGG|nr:hypothetical protein [Pangasianodon gigas]